jgi:hypothetical protein
MSRFCKILAFAAIFSMSAVTFAQDYSKLIGSSVCRTFNGSKWQVPSQYVVLGQRYSAEVSGTIIVYGFVDDFKNSKLKILVNKIKKQILTSSDVNVARPNNEYLDDNVNFDTISYVNGQSVWDDAANYSTRCP